MTKQEWIIKNDKPGVYIGAYREGLEKGLEIAEDFIDFVSNNYFTVERLDKKVYRANLSETGNIRYYTTAELLEIYLTEINEKK